MKQDRRAWLAAAALVGLLKTEGAVAAEAAAAGRAAVPAGVTAGATAESERAQLQRYADLLEIETAKAQERFKASTQQLMDVDKDIEARIDRIVKLLASITDSTDSHGQVRQSKGKAIEGLKKSIAYYVRERDKRNQEMLTPGAASAVEDLSKDVGVLDKRIDKRIDQITTLAGSMATHADFNRYEHYRDNDYDYNEGDKAFNRFERDVGAAVKTKAELIKNLKAGIDKQTREITALQETLRTTADPGRKGVMQEQIEAKEEIRASRREEVEKLLSGDTPQTKSVSSKGAFEIEKLLADMTLDLQRDFRKVQSLMSERQELQARARYQQDRLQSVRAGLAADAK